VHRIHIAFVLLVSTFWSPILAHVHLIAMVFVAAQAKYGTSGDPRRLVSPHPELCKRGVLTPADIVKLGSMKEVINHKVGASPTLHAQCDEKSACMGLPLIIDHGVPVMVGNRAGSAGR
jgi:hypothetical protein